MVLGTIRGLGGLKRGATRKSWPAQEVGRFSLIGIIARGLGFGAFRV